MKTKHITLTMATTLCISIASLACAEEGGSGHYLPGATADFIDTLPGRPAFAYVNAFTYYNGSAGASRPLPLGSLIAANVEATAYADTSVLLYETPWKLLGGNYAAAVTLPYVWMEVKGNVAAGPFSINRRDSANGIGDIQFFPFMLGWVKGDLKWDTRFSVYAPTGNYDAGQLANVGKNYWTFEPSASVSWLSSKIGLEVSAFTGLDFNTKNDATDYQTGAAFHLDVTVAEHVPLLGGFVGVGANTFYYQQITGDSGSGATFGGFEGRTVGIGPVLSYATKLRGKIDLVAEVKWLPELDTNKRLKGDYVWFKVALVF